MDNQTKDDKSYRLFEIVTDEYHPNTGEHILSEDQIKHVLEKYKTIKDWAYILHDMDYYTEADEKKEHKKLKKDYSEHEAVFHMNLDEYLETFLPSDADDKQRSEYEKDFHDNYEKINSEDDYIAAHSKIKAGTKKNNHWHIVLRFDRAQTIKTIAKWFGIKENFIEVPGGGARAFLDKIEYLTHEHPDQQALGKYLYRDDEVRSNFDFRDELTKRAETRERYGVEELSRKQALMMHVLHDGWSMRRCREEDPLTYADVRTKLPPLRLDYLADQPPVSLRITIYVDGNSGLGKSSFCRAIAETLFSECEHPYFSIGNDERVTFDGYDGEPCIIWNDMRVIDFITRFSPQGTYKIFDTHPDKEAQQAKHTRVILTNSVNIINGVQPYEEFIRGLAGTYKDRAGNQYKAEDETQAWRRFPMILCIREDDFDILLNQGFVNNDLYSVQQMILYNHVRGSMKKAMEQLGGEAKQIAVGTMIKPVADAYHFIEEKHENKITNPDEMPEEFLHYGETISSEEREAEIMKNRDDLHKEYEEWLDKDFFAEHDSLRGSDNHPTYEWWLEHKKHISSKRILV